MQTMRLLRSRRGFTLVEAMVVVAIAGIMVSVGYSGFSSLLQKEKVTAAANQLMGHLKEAKMLAMEKHASHAVDIDGNYTTFRDNNNNCTRESTEPIIHHVVLARDFAGVTIVSDPSRFRFDTRGMPKRSSGGFGATGITLTLAGKRECYLKISNVGRIDVTECKDL